MMIVHEVMGRDCGWLTAMTAHKYRTRLGSRPLDVHAVYIPEVMIDIEAEAKRPGRSLMRRTA
jgi:pyrophosphate--fructose-6-phosphate 1-phosphotransferase